MIYRLSNHKFISFLFQLRDEVFSGDLGLGDRGQPMRLQVNFGSPTGEHV